MKYINTNIYMEEYHILKFMLKNMLTFLLRKLNCVNMRQTLGQVYYPGKDDIS